MGTKGKYEVTGNGVAGVKLSCLLKSYKFWQACNDAKLAVDNCKKRGKG